MLGTYVKITAQGPDEEVVNQAIEAGFTAIDRVDQLLSSHRADSELNAINAAAGDRAITVSPWTYECISLAIQVGAESKGAFDITCRPILDLWGFVTKEYRFPDQNELNAVLPLVNYQNVTLLETKAAHPLLQLPYHLGRYRIGLMRAGMKLDVGGIGKGFAADKAVEALKKMGATAGLVCASGDIRGFGPQKWTIGIADPSSPDKAISKIDIQDEAISTSGDYRNFFQFKGRRYSHIINPKTGWPIRNFHSFSVRASKGVLADAWSKVFFVNPDMTPPPLIHIVDMR